MKKLAGAIFTIFTLFACQSEKGKIAEMKTEINERRTKLSEIKWQMLNGLNAIDTSTYLGHYRQLEVKTILFKVKKVDDSLKRVLDSLTDLEAALE